tara:strand:+ start:1791 stop:2201 length:411 start_codon:yes stop_codon:yes gene_type:complete
MKKPNLTTFTGSQKGLTIVKDRVYAYNQVGTAQLQSVANTLDFDTGKFVVDGFWTICGSVNKDGDSETAGLDQFYLKFNGTTVLSARVDAVDPDYQGITHSIPIIIPPMTHVEASAVCSINNDNWLVSNTITGRIY